MPLCLCNYQSSFLSLSNNVTSLQCFKHLSSTCEILSLQCSACLAENCWCDAILYFGSTALTFNLLSYVSYPLSSMYVDQALLLLLPSSCHWLLILCCLVDMVRLVYFTCCFMMWFELSAYRLSCASGYFVFHVFFLFPVAKGFIQHASFVLTEYNQSVFVSVASKVQILTFASIQVAVIKFIFSVVQILSSSSRFIRFGRTGINLLQNQQVATISMFLVLSCFFTCPHRCPCFRSSFNRQVVNIRCLLFSHAISVSQAYGILESWHLAFIFHEFLFICYRFVFCLWSIFVRHSHSKRSRSVDSGCPYVMSSRISSRSRQPVLSSVIH